MLLLYIRWSFGSSVFRFRASAISLDWFRSGAAISSICSAVKVKSVSIGFGLDWAGVGFGDGAFVSVV